MANQRNRKRPCVMIVEQSLEFGIKLADWLAAHGYQAVLVRSAERAIEECRELRPQAVFTGLTRSGLVTPNNARRLLLAIGKACPGISVVTMGNLVSGNLIQVTTSGGIRHVLVQPIDTAHIGRLLQAELNRTTASPVSSSKEPGSLDEGVVENLSYKPVAQGEAVT